VGATAAAATKLQQQQHASLTFLSQTKHRKEPKKSRALTCLTAAPPVLRMSSPEMNWRGIFSFAQEHEQDFKLYLVWTVDNGHWTFHASFIGGGRGGFIFLLSQP
jgi:hypothetical protein